MRVDSVGFRWKTDALLMAVGNTGEDFRARLLAELGARARGASRDAHRRRAQEQLGEGGRAWVRKRVRVRKRVAPIGRTSI